MVKLRGPESRNIADLLMAVIYLGILVYLSRCHLTRGLLAYHTRVIIDLDLTMIETDKEPLRGVNYIL